MFLINRGSFLTSSIGFFKNRIIDTKTGVDNVCEMFHNAYKHYATKLRASIDDGLRQIALYIWGLLLASCLNFTQGGIVFHDLVCFGLR